MNNLSALEAAIRMLSRRTYSEKEIRQRLAMRGYEQLAIDSAVNYLLEHDYINDRKLCQSLVNKLQQCEKYSIKAISAKLRQRGISADIVEEMVASIDTHNEFTAAMKLVNGRYKQLSTEDYAKVARFLTNRRFSVSTTTKVLECLFSDSEFG